MRTWFVVGALLVACKKGHDKQPPKQQLETHAQTGDAAAGGDADAAPAVTWTLSTRAVDLDCGEQPLQLPPTAGISTGAKERSLPRADTVGGCREQASVEAVCACLVKTSPTWASALGLSQHVECEPGESAAPGIQMLSVSSKPDDSDSTAAGVALVFAAKEAGGWSARAVVESAPDVDLSETPRASHSARVDRLDTHASAAGNVVLISSHHEAQDKSMGESEREGEAHATLCVVSGTKESWCSQPLLLGAWSYTYTAARGDEPDACTTTSVTIYSAAADASGVTLMLEHGTDKDSVAGRYTY